jgi:hypothetical protein
LIFKKANSGWFGFGKGSTVNNLKEELKETTYNLQVKIEENGMDYQTKLLCTQNELWLSFSENLQIRMQEMVASHAKKELENRKEIERCRTICEKLQVE